MQCETKANMKVENLTHKNYLLKESNNINLPTYTM